MPYLQLDVNGPYPVAAKKLLAKTLCETYASIMKVDIRRISIPFASWAKAASGGPLTATRHRFAAHVRHTAGPFR